MSIIATRRIEIDAGHRIPNHESKCFNVHGHRYVIEASIKGDLATIGPQEGMVLDFSFLKDVMIKHIDEPCDHHLMLYAHDPILPLLKIPDCHGLDRGGHNISKFNYGVVYIMPRVPTAENLARQWFYAMEEDIARRSMNRAYLYQVKVWETPNCWSTYARTDGHE